MKYKRGTLVRLVDTGQASPIYHEITMRSSYPDESLRGIVLRVEEKPDLHELFKDYTGLLMQRPFIPLYLIRWATEPLPQWIYEDNLHEV
jgi:hypothetical protein